MVKTEFYSGEHCLALPKLNLQFLTLHDYLLRSFNLFRLEANYQIREDLEDVVRRVAPRVGTDGPVEFTGRDRACRRARGRRPPYPPWPDASSTPTPWGPVAPHRHHHHRHHQQQ